MCMSCIALGQDLLGATRVRVLSWGLLRPLMMYLSPALMTLILGFLQLGARSYPFLAKASCCEPPMFSILFACWSCPLLDAHTLPCVGLMGHCCPW